MLRFIIFFVLQIQVLYLWLAILGIGPTVISQEGFGRMSSVSLLVTEMVGGTVSHISQPGCCPGHLGGVFSILLDSGGSLCFFMQ